MARTWHLNPFKHLKEHDKRPFARFFRTTLWQKCFDTYAAFIGKQQQSFEIDTIGIFDYLCLGLNLLLHQLFLWSYQNYKHNFQAFVLLIPISIFNLLAWCIKLFTSAILTIFCLPIIFICHQLSLFSGGRNLKSKAFDILGNDLSSTDSGSEPIKLNEFLTKHERRIADLKMELTIVQPAIHNKLINKISGFGGNITNLLLFRKQPNIEPELLKAQSKLTFIYYHPEEKNYLSNFSFLFSSVFLISMFPWLVIFSAKSITSSATTRITKAIIGGSKDLFEVIIDMENKSQQQQLSAIFKLNISSILDDLYKSQNIKEESAITSIQIEKQRLISLINTTILN